MVPSIIKKTISLAISLLVVVISLTGVALAANAPVAPFTVSRYTPDFAGAPGKMARDVAGNFYITDFWGNGIVKLDRQGAKVGFIATNGRPSAVAVLPDNRLVVAIAKPQPYVAFYAQLGSAPNVTGEEISQFTGTPTVALYRPVAITVDAAGKIYVLDSGDSSGDMNGFSIVVTPASIYRGNVKVYSPAGAFLHEFGERTYPIQTLATPGYFKLPQGISYEKAANQIVVVDTQNGRLQYFGVSNGATCTYSKSVGVTAGTSDPAIGAAVRFYNPVDVAFEYNDSSVLQRVYVAEKGKNQISIFDPVTDFYLMGISGITAPPATLLPTATMNQPASILFERTGTGASTAGVVYTANSATSAAANIMALGLDGGTVPVPTTTLTISTVLPATVTATPLVGGLSGTVSLSNNPVSCSVNGSIVSASVTGNNWSIATLNLVTGGNNIICKTTTVATGITTYAQASTSLVASPTNMTVLIVQPGSNLITKNSTVTVSGTSDTANATVSVVNGIYTVYTATNAAKVWSADINLVEGSNLITVSIWKQGTGTGSSTVTVIADYTAPVMSNSFLYNTINPPTPPTTNVAVQNIDGFVDEANLSSIEVNGETVPPASLVTVSAGPTYFSLPVTLVRGLNTVTVKATDLAGNISLPYERTVTLNPEIPGLTVNLPADNSFMSGATSASASGTVATSFAAVDAAGSGATLSAGTWNTTTNFAVSDLLNPYMFVASGGGNATVTAKRTIVSNAAYSQIAITNPSADLAVKTSPLVIEGIVAPNFSPTPVITIDGVTCAVTVDTQYATNGKFSCSPPSFTEGSHVIKATAGATTTVRNIILDTVNPELTIQADSRPMPNKISGSIEPSAKISAISAYLVGSLVTIPLSTITFDQYDQSGSVVWTADLNGYAYDSISFSSLDPAGNSSTLSYMQGIPSGDVNGDGTVRLDDALAALRHVAQTGAITDPTQFFNADVGGLVKGRVARDGVVDISDSVLILNKAFGLMAF